VLSSVALFSCQFAEQRRTGQGLGLIFSEQFNEENGNYQCVESVSEYRGWIYSWAFICGCLAPIFGIALFILMLFDCCCKVCCSKVMQGFLFFSAIFSSGCTLLVYLSKPCYFDGNGFTCKMGYGTVWTIMAFWSYLIGSLFLCFSPKHDPATCCYDDDDTKPAAKQQYDEEQPAPAPVEQKAAEATVVAAAVVQEEKKQPEEAVEEPSVAASEKESAVEEPSVAVSEKESAVEEPSVAAAEKESAVEEPSVAASEKESAVEEPSVAASEKESAVEEPSVASSEKEAAVEEEDAVEEPEEIEVKASVKEDGTIISRLDPSVTESGLDPDDSEAGEDPDGDKFESVSIKRNVSFKTTPW